MLHLQFLTDEMNRQRRVEAEQLRLRRRLAASARASRRMGNTSRRAAQTVRKAFQLRA